MAPNTRSGTAAASQTILIGLLVIFIIANVSQVVVFDLDLHSMPVMPSKLDFLSGPRSQSNEPLIQSRNRVPETKMIKEESRTAAQSDSSGHVVAGLTCDKHGGPVSEDARNEMVYWKDIPQDSTFESPLKAPEEQYLTFEPGTLPRLVLLSRNEPLLDV